MINVRFAVMINVWFSIRIIIRVGVGLVDRSYCKD